MTKFGKRKDGRVYPKTSKKTGMKGTVKNSGKIIRATGYWAKGDSSYSDFAWELKAIKSIVDRREKYNKQRFPDFEYELKITKGINTTIEYFGKSNGKIVDHFKIKRGRNGLWGMKNLPKKFDFKRQLR